MAANSTAEAVQRAVSDPTVAAVGTRLAAELYGGEIREPAIEDYADNQTRFVVIGRGLRERTGADKTSLALFMKADRPGTLHMILGEFVYGEINLTKIQSRPTKRRSATTCSSSTSQGHVDDAQREDGAGLSADEAARGPGAGELPEGVGAQVPSRRRRLLVGVVHPAGVVDAVGLRQDSDDGILGARRAPRST